MHSGYIHLGLNMLFLYRLGPILEYYLGKKNYTIYYIGMIIIAGFLTQFFTQYPTLGASGVLYAMITTIIVLQKYGSKSLFIGNPNSLMLVFFINIVFTFSISGISIIGHMSGIVAGILGGIVIMTLEEKGVI